MDLVQRQDKLQPSSSGEVGIYPSGQGYLNGFNDPGELKLFQLKNALNNKMSRAFDDSSPPSTILNGSDSSHLSAEIVQAETADDDMNQADVIEGLEVPRYQALIGNLEKYDCI